MFGYKVLITQIDAEAWEGLLHLLHEECPQLADANSDALADALN